MSIWHERATLLADVWGRGRRGGAGKEARELWSCSVSLVVVKGRADLSAHWPSSGYTHTNTRTHTHTDAATRGNEELLRLFMCTVRKAQLRTAVD